MACTLLALYKYEQRAGRSIFESSFAELESAVLLVWALINDQPEIDEWAIGSLTADKFPAAFGLGCNLITASLPPPKTKLLPTPGANTALVAAPGPDSPTKVDWPRLWALGRRKMGLSEQEFWSLTPLMLDVLLETIQQDSDAQFFAAGMVCAATQNCYIDTEKAELRNPLMFMPGTLGDAERARMETNVKTALKGKLEDFKKLPFVRLKTKGK